MIPLWLKIGWTAFVAFMVPVYWRHYGPGNFLWFSDIAVFGALIALWWEHRLIASMMAVSVGLLEIAWNIDYFGGVMTGTYPFGIAEYMSDQSIPVVVRGISLFHVVLPPLLVWMVWRLRYDSRALIAQTILAWIVLPLTYVLTKPTENINWVHGGVPGTPQGWMPALVWLFVLMLALPLVVYVPSHFALKWLDRKRRGRDSRR